MKVLNVSLLMVLARCSPEHRAFFIWFYIEIFYSARFIPFLALTIDLILNNRNATEALRRAENDSGDLTLDGGQQLFIGPGFIKIGINADAGSHGFMFLGSAGGNHDDRNIFGFVIRA